MGNDEALNDVILASRDELKKAVDASKNSPRPKNVCGSHDDLFGLVQATARATVTILTVLARCEPMQDHAGSESGGFQRFLAVTKALKPFAWPTALLCFSPNAVGIVRVVMDHFSK